MTREIIALVLENEGLKGGTQGFSIPEEREGTCLVSTPGDVLQIGRVVKVELRDKYVCMLTAKDERYSFGYEAVLGMRFLGTTQVKERLAGFSR